MPLAGLLINQPLNIVLAMMGHCGGQLVSVANIVGFRGRDPGLIPVTLRDFVT